MSNTDGKAYLHPSYRPEIMSCVQLMACICKLLAKLASDSLLQNAAIFQDPAQEQFEATVGQQRHERIWQWVWSRHYTKDSFHGTHKR